MLHIYSFVEPAQREDSISSLAGIICSSAAGSVARYDRCVVVVCMPGGLCGQTIPRQNVLSPVALFLTVIFLLGPFHAGNFYSEIPFRNFT